MDPIATVRDALPAAPRPAAGGDRLADAARQFEALFLHEMTKQARESAIDDEPVIGGGNADAIWRDLFHARLGERAAGSVGIADLLLRDLRRTHAAPEQPP